MQQADIHWSFPALFNVYPHNNAALLYTSVCMKQAIENKNVAIHQLSKLRRKQQSRNLPDFQQYDLIII